MIGKIRHKRIHGLEPRRIDHRAAVTPRRDKTRIAQAIEMERQRIGRQPQAAGNMACRHALRPGLDQKPEYGEAIVLRKRGQNRQSVLFSHISIVIETKTAVKRHFKNH